MNQNQIVNDSRKINLELIQNGEHKTNRSQIRKEDKLNLEEEEVRGEENSLARRQDKLDRKSKFNAFKITIGNDYVIRINQLPNLSDTKTNDGELHNGNTVPRKTEFNETKTFSLTSSTTGNVFKRKESLSEWQLNKSDHFKLEKLDTDTKMINAETLDTTEKKRRIDNYENGIVRGSKGSDQKRDNKNSETIQTKVVESNPIKKDSLERKKSSKKTKGEVFVQGNSTVNTNLKKIPVQQSDHENTITSESFPGNSTIRNGPSVATTFSEKSRIVESILGKPPPSVTFQEESADQKPNQTTSSVPENPRLQTSTANLSEIKKELDAWLQVDKLTRVNSDSLCQVLSQVLEEISSVNMLPAELQDSSDSSNPRDIIIQSNKYYIVNIEQIKSMAEILDRISKVIHALMKYSNPEEEMICECEDNFCACGNAIGSNGNTYTNTENGQETQSKTDSNKNSEIETDSLLIDNNDLTIGNDTDDQDTIEWIVNHATVTNDQRFSTLGTSQSVATEFGGYSTDDLDPESGPTSSVVVDQFLCESAPSSDNANSSLSSQAELVQTDSLLLKCCLFERLPGYSEATTVTPPNQNSSGSYNPYFNSLGSQTSGTELHSEAIGSQGESCQHDYHSLGSQTSDSDIERLVRQREIYQREMSHARESNHERELNQDRGRQRKSNRQKSRFRSLAKIKTNDSVKTTDELLALLDDVEKLLMNNCADRYEMMILLQQIFGDYAKSAQKAVTDLRKFIVTFNKNNSYL